MPKLRLIAAPGLPYKKFMLGGKWVGRLVDNRDGTFTGSIGRTAFTGDFASVVAQCNGLLSPEGQAAEQAIRRQLPAGAQVPFGRVVREPPALHRHQQISRQLRDFMNDIGLEPRPRRRRRRLN